MFNNSNYHREKLLNAYLLNLVPASSSKNILYAGDVAMIYSNRVFLMHDKIKCWVLANKLEVTK